ncbi:MAG: STAS domain-containing protein [Chitinivibrionales bacterium]
MKIASYAKGKYLVLRIHPHGENFPDLSELKDLIMNYLDKGIRHIAVNFVDTSYIYSGELRVLVICYKMVEERGGNLCIVEPNPAVFDILKVLNIDKIIRIYDSEARLDTEQ